MNVRRASFLLRIPGAALGLALAAPLAAFAADPGGANPTPAAMAAAEKNAPYPTFDKVPPAPKDVRSVQAWKSAILAVRHSGAELGAAAADQPWTLSDTEGFAARAHAEATPPPPVTSAFDPETAAKVAELRARAKEPPRSR
jgi:hypothetical protein